MKKLGKLQINSEKLMKNEELILLKGGYGGHCCFCVDSQATLWAMAASTEQECDANCHTIPMGAFWDFGDPTC